MPQLKLSDRDIETIPLVHRRMGSGFDTAIRARRDAAMASAEAMGHVPYRVEHGIRELERMKRTLDVRLDRDAEEVVTQWEAAMMAGLNGSVAADGSRIPGIASKTWADYEGTDASPITDLAEIEKNFQNSEAYKGMNSLVRKRFDQKVAVSRQRYLASANKLYDRNRIAKDAFMEKQSDAMHERKVETNLFSPDADFEAVSREEAFRKIGRKYANLGLIANPEVIDAPGAGPADIKWKDKKADLFFNGAYLDQLQKWGKGRCIALAQNAALGEVKIVDGKVVSNEAQLKAAEDYAAKLAQPQKLADGTVLPARISPAEAQEIGFKLVQARATLDKRIQDQLTGLGAAAIAQGDLASLEKANADLRIAAAAFPKDSRNQTTALVAAKNVDKAADGVATYDILTRLAKGDELLMSDGKTPIFSPTAADPSERRYAKLFPKAYETWTKKEEARQRVEQKKGNLSAAAAMLAFEEAGNPQGYFSFLAQKVMDGKLSREDFKKRRDEFVKRWNNGDGVTRSKRQEIARQMIVDTKEILGVDLSGVIESDPFGNVVFDKQGAMTYKKDVDAPAVKYTRHPTEEEMNNAAKRSATGTSVPSVRESFTSDEWMEIMNKALSLSLADGAEVKTVPPDDAMMALYGETMNAVMPKDGQPVRVDAVRDFRRFLERMKRGKDVESAKRELEIRRGEYDWISRNIKRYW